MRKSSKLVSICLNREEKMFDELKKVMTGRRSIRKYLDREIPRPVLEEVIETALWAPSGMNRQDWEIVVVSGKKRDDLAHLVAKTKKHVVPLLEKLFPEKIIKISLQVFENFGGAPTVLLVYVPREIPRVDPDMSEMELYHAEFKRFNRLLSASALVQNILLVAYAKGLGTCWMTGPKYVEKEINQLLGMEDKELVAIIPIGYPSQLPPAPPRKPNVVKWLSE